MTSSGLPCVAQAATPQRDFALAVVHKLRGNGFTALWAGGCVRDALLGRIPKDFDVACNATPDEVIQLFGQRRTVAVGVSFGVVMVLGPNKESGQVEVATFRSDGQYLDGRRPTSVRFCSPEEDAHRRDFTINGMFYDPVNDQVLDYVGGQDDLKTGIVRAIGSPAARFTEDKLRMLRAVRFAATFRFELDAATSNAIHQLHEQIRQVSVERISQELKRMFAHPTRDRAFQLLSRTMLLSTLFPYLYIGIPDEHRRPDECKPSDKLPGDNSVQLVGHGSPSTSTAEDIQGILPNLEDSSFESTFAVLFTALLNTSESPRGRTSQVRRECQRFKLSNDETERICWLADNCQTLSNAAGLPKHVLKPILSNPCISSLLSMRAAIDIAQGRPPKDADFCRQYLAKTPSDVLDPPALIDGIDLKSLGIPAGPVFRQILDSIRRAQLDEQIVSRHDALSYIQQRQDSSEIE